jgi:uncharacterized protein YjiS (DUF1127 family)
MKMVLLSGGGRPSPANPGLRSVPQLWAFLCAAIDDAATILFAWHERARQRRELLGLNDRELHDIGFSRADAAREGEKPFWNA